MIEKIILRRLLPAVFSESRNEPPVSLSELWLAEEVTFERGNRYIIEAESGTGKSSLCSFIYGSRDDFEGEILFDGRTSRSLTIGQWCELRRRALAWLPQEMGLFPELTVRENIDIKNRLTRFRSESEIAHMLARLGLEAKKDAPVGRLSVGQQQRVAIVRALCQPFDFMLLDEPVSHLDARNNTVVATLISEEATRQGAAVIATSVGNKISFPEYQLLTL